MRLPNLVAAIVILAVPVAHGQEEPAPDSSDRLHLGAPWDATVVAGSVAAMGLSWLIPVDKSSHWNTQLLPFDSHLEGRYSSAAANVSGILLAVDIAIPPALFLGQGLNADTCRRGVVYGESLLVSMAFDSLAKPLALASATADLRTRAGMHFYSDVLVGAAVGSGVGIVVPYLHGLRNPRLSRLEWLAIVLGPLVGIALGELLPVGG
jgi:hypothetical protein